MQRPTEWFTAVMIRKKAKIASHYQMVKFALLRSLMFEWLLLFDAVLSALEAHK